MATTPIQDNIAAPRDAGTDVITNDIPDSEKFWYTFATATFVATMTAVVLYLLITLFVGGVPVQLALILISALNAYILYFGFQSNGEYENSLGGLFGSPTEWVIGAGISWWVPKPFGSNLRPHSTEEQASDHRKMNGNALVAVQAKDGGQVEVSFLATWQVRDVRKAAKFADLADQADALLIRNARYFMLNWDSDAGENDGSNKKVSFSKFLVGDETITDRDNELIPNNLIAEADRLGILVTGAKVDDVNPPQAVIDAREQASKEKGEADAEELDIQSLRNRVLELMWGTHDSQQIKEKIVANEAPLMSKEDATRAVRTSRNDMEEIYVGGSGGDFTKGHAISSRK